MSENVYLINVILHDLLKGIWTDDSIKAFNVVEKKLKELDKLHCLYDELNSLNVEIFTENERFKKALSIIYNKGVYVRLLKSSSDLIEFHYWCKLIDPLTLEEYDLLKEVLNDEKIIK